jgi:Rod binding domain-containing protein
MGLETLQIELLAQTARMAGRPDPAAGLEVRDAKVRQAAEEFEAVFLAEMLGPIFDGLETGGLFGGGPGDRIYRSLMVREYAAAIARSDGIGIADSVQREILKLQEVKS